MGDFTHNTRLRGRNIRLVTIQQGSEEDAINLTLVVKSLDDRVPFNALSYAWGDQKDCLPVFCNEKQMFVTKSLYGALRTLRLRAHINLLWIDFVCINQSDTEEKTEQVRLMHEIYKKATTTIIWLGEWEKGDDVGFSLLQKVFSAYPGTDTVYDAYGTVVESQRVFGSEDEDRQLPELGLPFMASPDWEKLWAIYHKPWFSRVWVIQELCFATHCYFLCGTEMISQQSVLGVAARLTHHAHLFVTNLLFPQTQKGRNQFDHPSISNANTLFMLRQMYEKRSTLSLLFLLRTTMSFEATDQRDKVFALLGLANDGNYNEIIDYGKDLDSVLIWVADKLMAGSQDLTSPFDLLSFVHGPKPSRSIPSWLPDWQYRGYTSWEMPNSYKSNVIQLEQKPKWQINLDKSLITSGRRFDTVTILHPLDAFWIYAGVGPKFPPEQTTLFANAVARWDRRFTVLTSKMKSYPTGETVQEAHWRTMCLNLIPRSLIPSPPPEFECLYKAWSEQWRLLAHHRLFESNPTFRAISWLSCELSFVSFQVHVAVISISKIYLRRAGRLPKTWKSLVGSVLMYAGVGWCIERIIARMPGITDQEWAKPLVKQLEPIASKFERLYIPLWTGRSFCITDKGYMGWVPESTTIGDQICVLHGCRVPFILRPISSGRYEVVGDAYIHGRMDGEPFYDPDICDEEILIQ